MGLPANIWIAFALTIIAGLSTGIGSAIAYFIKKPKLIYLSFSLGFSAGVMIYVSFVELLAGSVDEIGEKWSVVAFFIGVIFIGVIDQFIPEDSNPHEFKNLEDDAFVAITQGHSHGNAKAADTKNGETVGDKSLMRTGMFTALAIGIHNFPEGLATFGTTLNNVELGIFITLAISIHNIPEGISVSMPLYYATGDKKLAFKYSFLSGVAHLIHEILILIKQSLLPFDLSDLRDILGYFDRTKIFPFIVPDREISDVNEHTMHLDPEFGHVPGS